MNAHVCDFQRETQVVNMDLVDNLLVTKIVMGL